MQAFDEAALFAMDVCRLDTDYMPPAEFEEKAREISSRLIRSCSGFVVRFSGVGLYPTEEFNEKGTVFGNVHKEGGLIDASVVPMTALPTWDIGDLYDMFGETDSDLLSDAIASKRIMEPEEGYRFLGKFLIAQGKPDDFLAGACIEGDVRYVSYVDLSSIVIHGIESADPFKVTEAKSPMQIDEMLFQLARSHRKILMSSKYLRAPQEKQKKITDDFVALCNSKMRIAGNEFIYWGEEFIVSVVAPDSGAVTTESYNLAEMGETSITGTVASIASLADIYLSNGTGKMTKRKLDANKALCLCVHTTINEREEIVYIPIADNIEDNIVVSVPYSVF